MIGWRPNPFIFVHIPKCAGASIEHALVAVATSYKKIDDVPERMRSRHFLPGKLGRQHAKLLEYNPASKKDFCKVSFVRNPWDRAVSQIAFLSSRDKGRSVFLGNTFKKDIYIYCHSKKTVLYHDLGACQLDYLLDRNKKLDMDFVGRFENLDSDFKKMCEIIGIEKIPQLPHINPSPRHGHYSFYYDAESVEWIRKRFARDINFFGYEFENQRPL